MDGKMKPEPGLDTNLRVWHLVLVSLSKTGKYLLTVVF
jgi:hypothetical protein